MGGQSREGRCPPALSLLSIYLLSPPCCPGLPHLCTFLCSFAITPGPVSQSMSWCILISIIFKRIMLSQSQSNRFLYRTFQKLLLLVIVCVFIFWQHGRHPGPLQWKKGVLTTGPPGNPSKALNMLIYMVTAPEEYVCVC